jgi:hypothetical protein
MDNPEITEGAVKNGQSREIGNIGYTRKTKANKIKKHSTICVGHHYAQTKSSILYIYAILY